MFETIVCISIFAITGAALLRPQKLTAKRWNKYDHKNVII